MNIAHIIQISIGAIVINNIVLTRLLGVRPLLQVSNKPGEALALGAAATLLMGMASALTWSLDALVLVPYDLTFTRIIVFVMAIAVLALMLEALRAAVPSKRPGSLKPSFIPLATNCAVAGVALLNAGKNPVFASSLAGAVTTGLLAGIGYTLALILMAGIREKLEFAPVCKSLKGLPIDLISAGLIALAFLVFGGLNIPASGG
jgi:electron transport complex protein RnfA